MITDAHYLAVEQHAERWFKKNGRMLHGDDNRYELAFAFYVDQHGKLCTTPLARGEGAEVEIPPVPEGCIEIGSLHTHCDCAGELSDYDMEQGQQMANKLGHDYVMFVAGPSEEGGAMLSSETFEPEDAALVEAEVPKNFHEGWLGRSGNLVSCPGDHRPFAVATVGTDKTHVVGGFRTITDLYVAMCKLGWVRLVRESEWHTASGQVLWVQKLPTQTLTPAQRRTLESAAFDNGWEVRDEVTLRVLISNCELAEAVSPEEDYNVEKDFAAKVMAGQAQLKDFPYYKDYAKTVDAEHAATGNGSIIFIGGGPVPITGILFNTRHRTPVTVLELEAEAVHISKALLTHLKIPVRVLHGDGVHFNGYGGFESICVALEAGNTREVKEGIFRQIAKQAGPDTNILVRGSANADFLNVDEFVHEHFQVVNNDNHSADQTVCPAQCLQAETEGMVTPVLPYPIPDVTQLVNHRRPLLGCDQTLPQDLETPCCLAYPSGCSVECSCQDDPIDAAILHPLG